MATQQTPLVVDLENPTVGALVLPETPEVVAEIPEPVAVVPDPPTDDVERGADGLYRLAVGNKVYKGRTRKELLHEAAKAIANGDTRIKELNTELKIKRGTLTPDRGEDLTLPQVQPISPDEAFQLSQDLLRPDGLSKAVRRVVEAELGIPFESLKNERDLVKTSKFKELAFKYGKEFVLAHPEFVPSRKNEEKIYEFMEQENFLPISLKNYEIAYAQIKDTLDLREPEEAPAAVVSPVTTAQALPAAPVVIAAPPAAPVAPARPRRATTGITGSDTSAPANAGPTVKGIPGYPTRDQIEAMSAKEYEMRSLRDAKFAEHVNAIYK